MLVVPVVHLAHQVVGLLESVVLDLLFLLLLVLCSLPCHPIGEVLWVQLEYMLAVVVVADLKMVKDHLLEVLVTQVVVEQV